MTWALAAAIAAGLITFAAVLAAIPKLWSAVKGFFGFLLGMEHVPELPTLREGQEELKVMVQESAEKTSIKLGQHEELLRIHAETLEDHRKLLDSHEEVISIMVEHVQTENSRLDDIVQYIQDREDDRDRDYGREEDDQ